MSHGLRWMVGSAGLCLCLAAANAVLFVLHRDLINLVLLSSCLAMGAATLRNTPGLHHRHSLQRRASGALSGRRSSLPAGR